MESPTPSTERFPELFSSAAPALFVWASFQTRGPLGGSLEAEDLVQEVAYQAFLSFESFDPARGEFRPWLFGVANHVTRMLLRRAAREYARTGPVGELASRAGTVPAQVTSISRRVARDEGLARFLEHAASVLDAEDTDLLLYRGLEGLPHAEVAELLGIEAATAKKRWQRLRERLQSEAIEGMLAPL